MSACSWAGSPPPGTTGTIARCSGRARAPGATRRSVRPVSSRASRSATASGSASPGSKCPPTWSHDRMRSCQRNRTRADGGCTTSADAVTCSRLDRDQRSASRSSASRRRATSATSTAPDGAYPSSSATSGPRAASTVPACSTAQPRNCRDRRDRRDRRKRLRIPVGGGLHCSPLRAVAQFGSALRSGRRGPGFKSRQPDQALPDSDAGVARRRRLRAGPRRCRPGG